MSDHTQGPIDPIDKAYAEAEAALADDAARAARRARLLAAVANEPAGAEPPPVAAQPIPGRRVFAPSAWGRGGWLAAASVAGLALFVAFKTVPPLWFQPEATAPAASSSTPKSAVGPSAQSSGPSADAAAPGKPATASAQPAMGESAAAPVMSRAGPPAVSGYVAPAPPAPQAFPGAEPPMPAPPPPPPPPPPSLARSRPMAPPPAPPPPPARSRQEPSASDNTSVSEVVVTGARREEKLQDSPVAVSAFSQDQLADDAHADPAARLRAAAAAGRLGDIKRLLAEGVPVDAEDDQGNTALMLAVRTNHPAAARLLLQHGASLDRRNHAGESARDLAARLDDPRLDKALGLDR